MTTTVYQHRRLDNNDIFYVGIGNKKRPYNKINRSRYWKNIVNKTEYIVEILVHKCSLDNAIILEKYFISKYKLKSDGGTLCNLTLGGEGPCGIKYTKERSLKISTANKRIWKESLDRYNSVLKANGKKVMNIETKEVFMSCKLASESTNIKYSTLRAQLNGSNSNRSNFKYI